MAVGMLPAVLTGRLVASVIVGISLDRVMTPRSARGAKNLAMNAANASSPHRLRRPQRPARSHGRAPKGGVAVMLSVKNA
jgi:hypothetical protein